MLDHFFRKYAWTANLLLLFAAAWLLARTVNTLVGAAVRPRPEVDSDAASAPAPRPVLPTALDTDKLYRLIGVEPPKVVDAGPVNAPPPRPQTCNDATARPVKSELRLQLVAGVLAERGDGSLATILDPQTREARVLGVGEDFNGARLLGVERVRDDGDLTGNAFKVVAVVCNGGTKEYIDDTAGAGTVAEAPNLGVAPVLPGRPVPPRPGAGPAVPGQEGIRKVAENRYDVDKQVIDSALSNLNTLATQARLVPSFKNGQANGFKLFQIQPGSLYSSIGIENGDVITKINGYEVNSPDKALEVYQKLKESKNVSIDYERGGQTFKKEINVGGP